MVCGWVGKEFPDMRQDEKKNKRDESGEGRVDASTVGWLPHGRGELTLNRGP